jgi:hypothetical protein
MYTVSKYTLWNITCHNLKICKKNYYMMCFDFKQKNIQMLQDALAMRRIE